jgi:transposase-like protein
VRIAGRWCYVFRAIDEDGQAIDVYVGPTRGTEAAMALFMHAVASTGVIPSVVTADRADLPSFARVAPEIEHSTPQSPSSA